MTFGISSSLVFKRPHFTPLVMAPDIHDLTLDAVGGAWYCVAAREAAAERKAQMMALYALQRPRRAVPRRRLPRKVI